MSQTLKHHTLPELYHDLQSLEYAFSIQEISEWTYKNQRGKLTAEIARREPKTINQ